MPQYLGSTKHFVSKVKEAAVQFTTNFVNANHANLSAATTVNEALAEFCEATYSCNAQWTNLTAHTVATTLRATRIGNRVCFNIDAFTIPNDTDVGGNNTRITFSKKLDPRFVPNYDGVAVTFASAGTGAPSADPKISFIIPFVLNGSASATGVQLEIYGDGTIAIGALSIANNYSGVMIANTSSNHHQTLPKQTISLNYDVIAGALKLMP